jgi:hypothetical protein
MPSFGSPDCLRPAIHTSGRAIRSTPRPPPHIARPTAGCRSYPWPGPGLQPAPLVSRHSKLSEESQSMKSKTQRHAIPSMKCAPHTPLLRRRAGAAMQRQLRSLGILHFPYPARSEKRNPEMKKACRSTDF